MGLVLTIEPPPGDLVKRTTIRAAEIRHQAIANGFDEVDGLLDLDDIPVGTRQDASLPARLPRVESNGGGHEEPAVVAEVHEVREERAHRARDRLGLATLPRDDQRGGRSRSCRAEKAVIGAEAEPRIADGRLWKPPLRRPPPESFQDQAPRLRRVGQLEAAGGVGERRGGEPLELQPAQGEELLRLRSSCLCHGLLPRQFATPPESARDCGDGTGSEEGCGHG